MVADVLHVRVSQEVFGEIVGISQQKVSQLVGDGVIDREGTVLEWLRSYCERLREMAAGRQGSDAGGLDLVQERAALARSQRTAQDLKNAIAAREYAPIAVLSEVLASASQAVVDRFDSLPLLLRTVAPDLPDATRQAIERLLADARNEWVRSTASLAANRVADEEEEDSVEEVDGETVEGFV